MATYGRRMKRVYSFKTTISKVLRHISMRGSRWLKHKIRRCLVRGISVKQIDLRDLSSRNSL